MSHQETLRRSVSDIAPHTRWVRLNEEKLEPYLAEVGQRDRQISFDPTLTDVGDAETRIAFVLMRDATNFGSGWHPHLKKRPGLSGARTTGTALAEFFQKKGAPEVAWLQNIEAATCAEIFGQTMTPPVGDLMNHFADAWRQLGNAVAAQFDGLFGNLVANANGSAVALSNMLGEIGHFRDIYDYRGRSFPFLKRAQLACYDLSLSLPEDSRCRFNDLSDLTIFVDNLVPHVLKVDGVLIFESGLNGRIDAGELIP